MADLFNRLTGYSNGNGYRRILVAPGMLRERLLELIREEAEADDGRIVMKMNSLVDAPLIETRSTTRRRPEPRSTSSCAASAVYARV